MNDSERASDRTASPARGGHAPLTNAFFNHSLATANGYWYADQAQAYANTHAFYHPLVGYMHDDDGGAYNPWYSQPQALYADHYDAGCYFGYSNDPTQLQPHLLPQYLAIEQQYQYYSSPPPQYTPYYGYDGFAGSARNFRLESEYAWAGDQMRGGHQEDLRSSVPSPKTELFIFHVPEDMSDKELDGIFSKYGKLERACIQRNGNGTSKGYGFVTYKYLNDAITAVKKLNNFSVRNKVRNKVRKKFLSVTFCRDAPHTSSNPPNTTSSDGNGGDRASNRKARRDKRFGRT